MLDGLLELFGNRVLAFDTAVARNYAELAVKAPAAGKGLPSHMVTSRPSRPSRPLTATHGFAVATRDVAPFQAAGLKVITPWEVRH